MAWKARPVGAATTRVAMVVLPVVASVVVAAVGGRLLTWPTPRSMPWWVVLLGGALLTSVLVGRLARRLLPLAMLLRLSLVFPDRTPSRFGVALRAGTVHRLRRELEAVRTHGIGDDANHAAETVLVLAAAMNAHDPLTRGHSERVRAFTDMLATELHLSPDAAGRLRWSALLHDCGKLTVHADVLNKDGPLTEAEWEAVRRHPEEGAKLTLPLRGWLGSWAAAIEEHHERWDGTGYPNGLAGDRLSFGARIVAVADAYEVMTAARAYKAPLSTADARAELAAGAGQQFDPVVVRAFLGISLGRAGWLAGPLGFLAGLAAVRQVAARAPADAPSTGIAAAALGVAALLGILAPAADVSAVSRPPVVAVAAPRTTTTVPPEAEIELIAAPPAEPTSPAEVLGVQFTRPEPVAPTTLAPTTTVTTPTPTTAVAPPPITTPPSELCTAQAQIATARTPSAGVLAQVRARKAHVSKNPNCTARPPGQ
jgi:hypothetical protein